MKKNQVTKSNLITQSKPLTRKQKPNHGIDDNLPKREDDTVKRAEDRQKQVKTHHWSSLVLPSQAHTDRCLEQYNDHGHIYQHNELPEKEIKKKILTKYNIIHSTRKKILNLFLIHVFHVSNIS